MALERNLASIWEAVADRVGDAPAVVQGSLRRSWTDFDDRAARLASAFADVGVGPGSKVAQYLYNSAEYMESFYAAMKLRAIPVNVNYRYLDEELLYLLENSESEVLLFHSSLADRVERVADRAKSVKLFVEVSEGNDGLSAVGSSYDALIAGHELAPRITRQEDDVLMTYTGGTTGMPKGVMSRVKGAVDTYLASVPVVLGMAPLSEPEEIITTAGQLFDEGRQYASMPACPLMHGTGMGIGALPATTFGGRLVLLEGRGLDVDELWSTVERESVNAITIVGDAFARPLLRALDEGPKRDLTSVNLLLSAGSMFSAEIKGGLLEHLETCMIIDYIAATEGAMGISISTKGNPAPTGRFIPNPGVKVLTEDGREVVAGSDNASAARPPPSLPPWADGRHNSVRHHQDCPLQSRFSSAECPLWIGLASDRRFARDVVGR